MELKDENNTKQFIIDLKGFFENIDTDLKNTEIAIQNKELERDDLLHEIELGKLNAIELSVVSGRLRKTLQERRTLKNEREFIYTLKGFADKYITKGIIGDTNQLLLNIENLNKARDVRKYTPRILKDLKIGKWKNEEVK